MAKGFIRGTLMGTAVSVIGLSALSVWSGLPDAPRAPSQTDQTAALQQDTAASDTPAATETPPTPAAASTPAPESESDAGVAGVSDAATPPSTAEVDVPAGSVFNAPREDGQAVLPQADAVPQIATAPMLDSATPPANPPLSMIGRDSAAQPQADQGAGSLATPPDAVDAPIINAPVTGTAPNSTAPAEPQAPAARADGTGPAVSTEPVQPDQAQAEADQTSPDRPAPAEEDTGLAALAPMPAPQTAPRRQPLPVIEAAPPAVTPEQTAPQAPVAVPDTAPLIRPAIGTPATSLVDRPAPGNEAAETNSPDDAIPLRRNALAFEDPEGRPRLAIVLIDRGDTVIGVEALRDFPYPLTFAVDAARPDAAEASARYRAAGFEVMALVDLAVDSTPQDAEVAMEVSLSAVPDAVAVMEGDATGFQASRPVSDQVAAIAGQRGYGLVMLPNGLNTAQRQAARTGVPSATVFRDFDGAGQDAAAIRRFLDQGAFRAGQQASGLQVEDEGEGVIMLGRLRPDTISALLLWGLQDRSQRVALAPVSAVLDPAD